MDRRERGREGGITIMAMCVEKRNRAMREWGRNAERILAHYLECTRENICNKTLISHAAYFHVLY